MTRIKTLPVDVQEAIQWLLAWRSNRELAYSAMPDTLFAFFKQEAFIDHDWELTDRGYAFVARMAGPQRPVLASEGGLGLEIGNEGAACV